MQDPNERIQRSLFKITAWTLGVLIVLIGGSIFGYKSYRAWQERRLVAQGNALFTEGNLKRASLDARRILQLNPESAPGCRLMARISEQAELKAAVDWRRRVIELEPGNANDLIALARTALRFDDKGSLDLALSKLPEAARRMGEYHSLAADLAAQRGDLAEMEKHLREAARLDPGEKENLMRLASAQLASDDTAVRAEGKKALLGLQSEPALRSEALRRMVAAALRRPEAADAVPLARQLEALPDRTFTDRLLLLKALHEANDPGFTPLLQELQTSAAASPEEAAELISWLNAHRMPAAAIAWGSRLSPETISQGAVPVALSESYIAAADWAGMQRIVQKGNWGGIDFLRQALAARAARELRDEPEAAARWAEAIQKVSSNPKQALSLAEIVGKWGWQNEAIELLWVGAKDPADGDAALATLSNHFAKIGATPDLYRVLLRQLELWPGDRNVQNNVAQVALLLNLNSERAQRMARDLHEQEPANVGYASTYAFALHYAGGSKKAVKVMAALKPEELQQPAVAAYYGIILAGAGERARAEEFLDLGQKAGLLPEEKALLEKARRTLAQR